MPPSQPQSRSAAALWPSVCDATTCAALPTPRKQHPQSSHEEMRRAARRVGRLIEIHGGTVLADIDAAWLHSRRRRAARSRPLEHLSRDRDELRESALPLAVGTGEVPQTASPTA